MLDAALKRAAKELGLKLNRELAYGLAQGYAVSLCRGEKTYDLFVDARLGDLDEETAAALKAELAEACTAAGTDSFAFNKTGICASWPAKKANAESAAALLRTVTEKLAEKNVVGVGCCSNCGAPLSAEDAKLVKIGTHVHLCDSGCAHRLTAAFGSPSHTRKNVGAGIFGALIAAVVAVVPYAALSHFGFYAAPAAFLVPILVSLGYRAFSGKPCAAKGIVVTLFSLLSLAVTAALLLCYGVYDSWVSQGYVFVRSDLFAAVLQALKSGALVKTLGAQNLAYCGVFLLLGLVFTLPQAVRRPVPYGATLPL